MDRSWPLKSVIGRPALAELKIRQKQDQLTATYARKSVQREWFIVAIRKLGDAFVDDGRKGTSRIVALAEHATRS
ncbi:MULTISPECIES: hypothetical protein [unclassified Burkholderia]|uniref:hypothetical protein n=1 Tax=unclassified Burkholderia TaxID=2613784 RepID=UPI000F582155|nr:MULTISPECIES: hypothetical protein [unclassified Burkholderia]